MTRNNIIISNLITVALYILSLAIKHINPENNLFQAPLIAVSFLLVITIGLSLAYIQQQLFYLRLDKWLFFLIAILNTFFFLPVLFTLIFFISGTINYILVLLTLLAIFLLPVFWPKINNSIFHRPTIHTLSINKKNGWQSIFHPVIFAFLFILTVHIINTNMYAFLPAPDSYSWLSAYNEDLHHEATKFIGGYDRLTLASFTAIIKQLSDVDLFILFKYVYPLFSAFTVFPLWLLARRLKSYPAQLLILLPSFLCPAIIYELEMTRQIILFFVFLPFYISLLYEAKNKKDRSLFLLTGFFTALGSFAHPLFNILTIFWLLSFVLFYWRALLKPKIIPLLLIALAVLWKFGLRSMITRIRDQVIIIFENIAQGEHNFKFPAHFVNVDNNEVGWAGLTGVLKYYGFYLGPLAALILLTFTLLIIFNKKSRQSFLKTLLSPYTLPVTLSLLFFLSVAEIFPRFVNIAYLPERSLQYFTLSLLFIAFLILKKIHRAKFWRLAFPLAALLAMSVNVAGASYISYLNIYVFPEYEWQAMKWIKNNLPPDRIIFSRTSGNLISIHSGSRRKAVWHRYLTNATPEELIGFLKEELKPPDYVPLLRQSMAFAESTSRVTELSNFLNDCLMHDDYPPNMEGQVTNCLACEPTSQGYKTSLKSSCAGGPLHFPQEEIRPWAKRAEEFSQEISNFMNDYQKFALQLELETNVNNQTTTDPVYIYYSLPHEKNPYSDRPYLSLNFGEASFFPPLDENPGLFTRVYEDEDKVIIWKVSPEVLEKPNINHVSGRDLL